MSRPRAPRLASAVVVLAASLACSDSSGPERNVTGTWQGTLEGVAVELVLDQEGSEVVGAGTMSAFEIVLPLSVEGSFDNPDLDLMLTAEGFEPFSYTAEMTSGSRLEGEVFGSGYAGESLTLVREQQ